MQDIDYLGATSRVFVAPKSQTNNTGAFICDLEGTNFIGLVGVHISIGTKTAGDSDAVITLRLTTSATNNISNATNYTVPISYSSNGTLSTTTNVVTTSNNTTNAGTLVVDTRSANIGRYLFYSVALTGTNSPAYPIAVSASGQKKVN